MTLCRMVLLTGAAAIAMFTLNIGGGLGFDETGRGEAKRWK